VTDDILLQTEDLTKELHGFVAVKGVGLARSFQISSVFPHLTVLEKVRIPGPESFFRMNKDIRP